MLSSISNPPCISKEQVEQLRIFDAYCSVIRYGDASKRPSAQLGTQWIAPVYADKASVAPSRSLEDVCEIIRGLLDEVGLSDRFVVGSRLTLTGPFRRELGIANLPR